MARSIMADTYLVTPKLFTAYPMKAGKLKPRFCHPCLQPGQPCDPDPALGVRAQVCWEELLDKTALVVKQMD